MALRCDFRIASGFRRDLAIARPPHLRAKFALLSAGTHLGNPTPAGRAVARRLRRSGPDPSSDGRPRISFEGRAPRRSRPLIDSHGGRPNKSSTLC